MKTKIQTTLLTVFFFFGLLTGIQAQDKYEYAVITFRPGALQLIVSINGSDFKKVDVTKSEIQDPFDTNPALKEISKMNADGWEVFSTGELGANNGFIFYLRKKK